MVFRGVTTVRGNFRVISLSYVTQRLYLFQSRFSDGKNSRNSSKPVRAGATSPRAIRHI